MPNSNSSKDLSTAFRGLPALSMCRHPFSLLILAGLIILSVGPAVDCSLPTVSSPETDDAELRDTELGDADIGDEQPEDAIADKPPEAATSDRSTDVDYEVPSESDSPAYKPPPKKRQTAAKEKEKKSAKPVNKPKRAAAKMASQPHPLSPPITGISRANTSSARSKKNSGKESTKPKAKGHQEQSLKKNKMDAPKPKRKAKQPLLVSFIKCPVPHGLLLIIICPDRYFRIPHRTCLRRKTQFERAKSSIKVQTLANGKETKAPTRRPILTRNNASSFPNHLRDNSD